MFTFEFWLEMAGIILIPAFFISGLLLLFFWVWEKLR